MRVLGVDPGLNITGYGVVDSCATGSRLVEAGEVRSSRSDPLERRLSELFTGLEEIVREFSPDAVSVEDVYSHYNHPRTAVIMGHARGVAFLVAGKASIPVFSYSATRIKKSLTGVGNASKEQVARMVHEQVSCGGITGKPDVTDAIAAALCHLNAIAHGGML